VPSVFQVAIKRSALGSLIVAILKEDTFYNQALFIKFQGKGEGKIEVGLRYAANISGSILLAKAIPDTVLLCSFAQDGEKSFL